MRKAVIVIKGVVLTRSVSAIKLDCGLAGDIWQERRSTSPVQDIQRFSEDSGPMPDVFIECKWRLSLARGNKKCDDSPTQVDANPDCAE